MEYFIRQEKNRKFTLEKRQTPIYSLKFPKWNSSNAEAQLSDGRLKFTRKSFWKSEYLITKNRRQIGKITSNWKGHLFIHLLEQPDLVPSDLEMNQEKHIVYRLKPKGVFKQRYDLLAKDSAQSLITLHPKSNWLKVNYEVELLYPNLINFPLEEILGMMTFCAVLIRKRQAAAAGGAA